MTTTCGAYSPLRTQCQLPANHDDWHARNSMVWPTHYRTDYTAALAAKPVDERAVRG